MTAGTWRRAAAAVALAVAALGAAGCERTEVDGIGSYTGDEDAPPQRDLDVFEGCTDGGGGWVDSRGVLVNRSPVTASYEITVGFYDDQGARLTEESEWVADLGPEERRRFEVAAWLPDETATAVDCKVLTIDRWGADESGATAPR